MLPQKSGSSEMPFPAFWAPNYHASTSGNYSVCMAIRCEINIKKNHSSIAILGTGQTILLTKREGVLCTRKRPVAFLIFHPFVSFLFLRSRETMLRSISCNLQLRLESNESKIW